MKHTSDIHAMGLAALKDYVRERFYRRVLDPPIDERRMVSVGAFLVGCFKLGDESFKDCLRQAVTELLVEWARKCLLEPPPDEEAYLDSLAFLVSQIRPPQPEAYRILHLQAEVGRIDGNEERLAELTEWHIYAALAEIQTPGHHLADLWRRAWRELPERFWGPVYEGMRRCDPDLVLDDLAEAIRRWLDSNSRFHPGATWARYARRVPDGVRKLADRCKRLRSDVVVRVSQALHEVRAIDGIPEAFDRDARLSEAVNRESFWQETNGDSPPTVAMNEPFSLAKAA